MSRAAEPSAGRDDEHTGANRIRNALVGVVDAVDVVDVEMDLPAGLATVRHERCVAETSTLFVAAADAVRGTRRRHLPVPLPRRP